jgi:hypothetical protein
MAGRRSGRELRPPRGGTPPPDRALLDGGEAAFLAPLAHETTVRYGAEFPDERERYGDAWFDWCLHDTQWILSWAAAGEDVLDAQLAWLAELLAARDFPLERVRRCVELAADVVDERHGEEAGAVSGRLRTAAAALI